jgi:hypothetical protein
MHDARAHVFENLFAAAKRFFGAANHEGKGGGARSADTSGNWRVERETALLACNLMRTPCAPYVDCGRIDDERALGESRQDFGPDVDHVLAGWQHRYKGARALDCLGSAFRKRYACFRGGHLRLLTEIETRNLKASLDEIGGHRPAHIAEPDESDSLVVHFIILSLRKPVCQPLAREGRQLHAP